MIASACIATGLPPEAFGVEATPELGAVMITVLKEQAMEQKQASQLADLRARGSR